MKLPRRKIHRLCRLLVVLVTLAGAMAASAAAPVEVVALFKDRAVVRTADEQQMLKVGETSPGGVKLLQADTAGARVSYGGEAYNLTLSARVAGSFARPTSESVRISRDAVGQYRMRGSLNDHMVDFLVDTGASVVALSERQAQQMGLDYQSGQRGTVQTAQGNANAYFVLLDRVTLGGITRQKVRATVIEGSYPIDVLLGMSFLNTLSMNDNNGVLTLTANF
ncbi:MAG: TIGR02281 family clan AA aspartic protease [bacterium]